MLQRIHASGKRSPRPVAQVRMRYRAGRPLPCFIFAIVAFWNGVMLKHRRRMTVKKRLLPTRNRRIKSNANTNGGVERK
jgi:hypothetical protein